jgi:hypothetical protein
MSTLRVTTEDQQHINTFSKYNARVGELQEELKERQVSQSHFSRPALVVDRFEHRSLTFH